MNYIISEILDKYVGEYVDGIGTHSNIELWSYGTYAVGPLRIKQTFLNSLNLPISIYGGKINRLLISIPWLQSFTKGITLSIEGVELDIGPPNGEKITIRNLIQHIKYCIEEKELPDNIVMGEIERNGCIQGYAKKEITMNGKKSSEYYNIDIKYHI